MNDRRSCFVIMPFSNTRSCRQDEWTTIFQELIRPAVEESGLGFTCRRSDTVTGNVIRDILMDLHAANVVIADLTDQRANVMYELGVRHALATRTIMIAQRSKDIPSDLKSYKYYIYDWKTTRTSRTSGPGSPGFWPSSSTPRASATTPSPTSSMCGSTRG